MNKNPVTFKGLDGLKKGIEQWLERIRTEMQSHPIVRQLHQQEEQLAALKEEFANVPDEFFSQDEAAALRIRLDELEQRMAANLKQSIGDKDTLTERITSISADIQMLKDNVETLSKPHWRNALASRLFGWLQDPNNQKLLVSGVDVARNLLEGGHKSAGSGQ